MSPLTNRQKADVCRMAKRAWDAWDGREEYCGGINAGVSHTLLFGAWRHEEQERVVGRRSLTTATQHDYAALMAHFAAMAGLELVAGRWVSRQVEDGRNRVLYILRRDTLQRGLVYPGYPEAICRKKNRCGLGAATEKQLWHLVYTVRNRRKAVR